MEFANIDNDQESLDLTTPNSPQTLGGVDLTTAPDEVIYHLLYQLKQDKARIAYEIDQVENLLIQKNEVNIIEEKSNTVQLCGFKLNFSHKLNYKLDLDSPLALTAAKNADLIDHVLNQSRTKNFKLVNPAAWYELSQFITSTPAKVAVKIEPVAE